MAAQQDMQTPEAVKEACQRFGEQFQNFGPARMEAATVLAP